MGTDRVLNQRQSKPGASHLLVGVAHDTIELLEYLRVLGRRDSKPAVAHRNDAVGAAPRETHADRAPGAGILHGVTEEIQDDLLDGVRIARRAQGLIVHGEVQHKPLLLEWIAKRASRRAHDWSQGV